MAAPAKLEFDSWIETLRKHIEQADPHTGRPNFHRGTRIPHSPSVPVQAALESLKSLHNELVIRAAEIEPSKTTESVTPFNDALAQQVSSQVADRVVSTLASQLSQQLSDQISTLFETKLKQLEFVDSCIADNDKLANQIVTLESEIAELHACRLSSQEQLRQLADERESQFGAVQRELAQAYESIAVLEKKLADSKISDWSIGRNNESETNERAVIAELEAEIASLQTALAAVREDCWQVKGSSADVDKAKLTAELVDLRQQNSNLALQLAEAQSGLHNPPHLYLSAMNQESMTWEQRKKLIMQQFENELADTNHTEQLHNNRIGIEDVLRTTQAEIDRRDKEIAELKSIVEQQSNTHDGVAIGAAAIAQMLDSDELVKLEREKLAAIQREWESKLRDAEIQISTERARLSRERLELESQARKLSEQTINLPPPSNSIADTKTDGKPVRRWLEHLGLRDQ